MSPPGKQLSCGPAVLCPCCLTPPYSAALCPSQSIPPYPTGACPSHIILPEHSATPTYCVSKCFIWWPLPLRFAGGLSNFLGHPSTEMNMACLLQYPPDGHHCPQVDMTRDVFIKHWQILTEIRPRPCFAFINSSHTSMPPTASGSDNIHQQMGATFTGTGVRFHHADCSCV